MGIKTAIRSTGTTRRRPASTGATLGGALFSATQQRVLGLLFGQPERSFFATEIIGLAQAGSGAVQRELQRLAESGLVVVTRVGNQKHYQANRASPIFGELRGIAVKVFGPAEALRTALIPLASRVRAAWLYGSVAKGTDRAASDLDVMIVAENLTLEETYRALRPAEKRLGRAVHPTLYTPQEFRGRRAAGNPFLSKVMSGKRILLMGDEDAVGTT
jgi:predicted nucleotidyltransferase